jgi:hypothetical protein
MNSSNFANTLRYFQKKEVQEKIGFVNNYYQTPGNVGQLYVDYHNQGKTLSQQYQGQVLPFASKSV